MVENQYLDNLLCWYLYCKSNIIDLVESNKYLDMPDLIEHCKAIKKVTSIPCT